MPFLFTNRKELELKCANDLLNQIKQDNNLHKFFISCHKDNEEFKKIKFPDDITTISVEKEYSISEPINIAAKQSKTEYFCFIHCDVFFENKNWISDVINLHNKLDNTGILGIQHHDMKIFSKYIDDDIRQVIWADGIMFFKTELFDKIGYFDESYFADCESKDFSFKSLKAGFKNYLIEPNSLKAHHVQTNGFLGKSKNENFHNCIKRSRELFKSIWGNYNIEYAELQTK